ncbi:hypothetical protein D3C71_2123660 [compost metagenome]
MVPLCWSAGIEIVVPAMADHKWSFMKFMFGPPTQSMTLMTRLILLKIGCQTGFNPPDMFTRITNIVK